MHYYQHHIGDYKAATAHLTNEEDLAYRRLLEMYYDTELPIPVGVDLCRKLRVPAETISIVLDEFFTPTESGWIHGRCEKEISAYQSMKKGGKDGADKRWGKGAYAPPMPTQSPTQSLPNANHEPVTSNHEPVTNSVTNVTGAKAPLTPDEIIFGYGLPLLTNAGTADKQARSFLGGLRKQHGDDALVNALRGCIREKPLQPLEWLAKVLPPSGAKGKPNKQEALEQRNKAIGRAWASKGSEVINESI